VFSAGSSRCRNGLAPNHVSGQRIYFSEIPRRGLAIPDQQHPAWDAELTTSEAPVSKLSQILQAFG